MEKITKKLLLLITLFLVVPQTSGATPDMSSLGKRIKVYFKYVRGTVTQQEQAAAKTCIEKDLDRLRTIMLMLFFIGGGSVVITAKIHEWIERLRQQDQTTPVLPDEKYGVLVNTIRNPHNGNMFQMFGTEEEGQYKITFVEIYGPNQLVNDRKLNSLKHFASTWAKDHTMAADIVIKSGASEQIYSLKNGTWVKQNSAH